MAKMTPNDLVTSKNGIIEKLRKNYAKHSFIFSKFTMAEELGPKFDFHGNPSTYNLRA